MADSFGGSRSGPSGRGKKQKEQVLDAATARLLAVPENDFTDLPLKPDHPNRPFWVTPNGSIYLEASSPLYEQARDFLIAICEPISRPDRIHEYRLDKNALIAAASMGLSAEVIIAALSRLSKVEVSPRVVEFIQDCTSGYGKVKLVLQRGRYYIESAYPAILRVLNKHPFIRRARIKYLSDGTRITVGQLEQEMKDGSGGVLVSRLMGGGGGAAAGGAGSAALGGGFAALTGEDDFEVGTNLAEAEGSLGLRGIVGGGDPSGAGTAGFLGKAAGGNVSGADTAGGALSERVAGEVDSESDGEGTAAEAGAGRAAAASGRDAGGGAMVGGAATAAGIPLLQGLGVHASTRAPNAVTKHLPSLPYGGEGAGGAGSGSGGAAGGGSERIVLTNADGSTQELVIDECQALTVDDIDSLLDSIQQAEELQREIEKDQQAAEASAKLKKDREAAAAAAKEQEYAAQGLTIQQDFGSDLYTPEAVAAAAAAAEARAQKKKRSEVEVLREMAGGGAAGGSGNGAASQQGNEVVLLAEYPAAGAAPGISIAVPAAAAAPAKPTLKLKLTAKGSGGGAAAAGPADVKPDLSSLGQQEKRSVSFSASAPPLPQTFDRLAGEGREMLGAAPSSQDAFQKQQQPQQQQKQQQFSSSQRQGMTVEDEDADLLLGSRIKAAMPAPPPASYTVSFPPSTAGAGAGSKAASEANMMQAMNALAGRNLGATLSAANTVSSVFTAPGTKAVRTSGGAGTSSRGGGAAGGQGVKKARVERRGGSDDEEEGDDDYRPPGAAGGGAKRGGRGGGAAGRGGGAAGRGFSSTSYLSATDDDSDESDEDAGFTRKRRRGGGGGSRGGRAGATIGLADGAVASKGAVPFAFSSSAVSNSALLSSSISASEEREMHEFAHMLSELSASHLRTPGRVERFEIDAAAVDEIRRLCVNLDPPLPMMQEYDFRQDRALPNLDISLRDPSMLRPYQEKSLAKMFGNSRARSGIIVLPCGAGKTLVGIAAACTVGKSCIVLCPNQTSVNQWIASFHHFSNIPARRVKRLTSSDKDELPGLDEAVVVFTTYTMIGSGGRSAASAEILSKLKSREWGLMVLDEVHQAVANTFKKVLALRAHCKLGLTATLVREDGRDKDLSHLIGPKLYEANWQDLTRAGYLANVQVTEVWCPMAPEFYSQYLQASSLNVKQALAVMNPIKCYAMDYLLRYHEERGHKIIVFSESVFALKLYGTKYGAITMSGDVKLSDRESFIAAFKSPTSGVNKLFLSKVGDVALDVPDANVIIQISSHFGSRLQEAQRLGRILRKGTSSSSSGNNAFFYTLVSNDTMETYFSNKRRRYLVDQGYAYKVLMAETLVQGGLPGLQRQARFLGDLESRLEMLRKILTENVDELEEDENRRYAEISSKEELKKQARDSRRALALASGASEDQLMGLSAGGGAAAGGAGGGYSMGAGVTLGGSGSVTFSAAGIGVTRRVLGGLSRLSGGEGLRHLEYTSDVSGVAALHAAEAAEAAERRAVKAAGGAAGGTAAAQAKEAPAPSVLDRL